MKEIDPDIAAAVRAVFETRRAEHVGKIRDKHTKQLEDELETKIQLLWDEVSQVLDPKHPLFPAVLLLTVVRKITKQPAEPEYRSCLGEGIPKEFD
jgi:hypothetical protein